MAQKQIDVLTDKLKLQEPLVAFAEQVTESSDTVDIGELAKIIKKENISNIGRNKLFEFLRDQKIIMKNSTIPYQKYIDENWFKVVETVKETSTGTRLFLKTLATSKGQMKIFNLLKEHCEN